MGEDIEPGTSEAELGPVQSDPGSAIPQLLRPPSALEPIPVTHVVEMAAGAWQCGGHSQAY